VTASGLVSLAAESVVNSTANVITADGLALKGVSSAGLPTNRIRTDVKNMYLANSGGLYLENKGNVNIAQMDANGVVDIVAGGNVSSAEKLSSEAVFNVVSSGSIDFSNTGNLLNGPISLEATTGAITLKNASNVNFSKVEAKKLTVAATGNIVSSGNMNVTGDSRLSASGDILITGSNDFSTVDLSANNIVLHDNNTVDLTNVVALTGAEINAGNGVGIGRITAPQLLVNAGAGQITDVNGDAMNITADKIILRAGSGIGVLNALETQTAELDIINQSGGLEINNKGRVLLTNLVTKGDIKFVNDLDVTLDRVDADYATGNLNMNVTNGSIFGLSARDYRNAPDISAKTAYVSASVDVGTSYRPVSVNINDEFALFSNVGSIYYFGGRPDSVIDGSKIKVSVFDALVGLSGQQLITVETLAEIDPAIFTEVKNFNQGEISVMLPDDQRYDEDDEVSEEVAE
ncbi:MAG: hypothetical protein U1B30_00610, partial [Pseudomonadota bacterium]|nr:hypothetical protein [Pseudomonadota bacterium]